MKPRRVPSSNFVYRLPGGTEDDDLWVERGARSTSISTWELDEAERAAIAAGGTIELCVWGHGHPPVSLAVGPSLEDRRADA